MAHPGQRQRVGRVVRGRPVHAPAEPRYPAGGNRARNGIRPDQPLLEEGNSPAGIYRTNDGGDTSTHVVEPPADRPNEEFSAVEFCTSDPNIAYAGSAAAIYRSTDAGVTWTQMTPSDVWGPPGVRAGWPIDLQCDPRDTNRLFANNYQGGAFFSEDGGATWINTSQGYTGAQVFTVVVDPHNSARAYVMGAAAAGARTTVGRRGSACATSPSASRSRSWPNGARLP